MHRIGAICLLGILYLLTTLGCAGADYGGKQEPPVRADLGLGDGIISVDGGSPNDSQGDLLSVDSAELGPPQNVLSLRGEIMPAGTLSTGGAFTLVSNLGPGLNATHQTGGSYSLRWFTVAIPW
jgi:hypothetical protein